MTNRGREDQPSREGRGRTESFQNSHTRGKGGKVNFLKGESTRSIFGGGGEGWKGRGAIVCRKWGLTLNVVYPAGKS